MTSHINSEQGTNLKGRAMGFGSPKQQMYVESKVTYEEQRLFGIFLLFSLTVHTTVYFLGVFHWGHKAPLVTDEWSMSADLVTDFETTAPDKTVIPKTQVAPEAKVAERLLPQLPKQFTVKDNTKLEEAIPLEKAAEPIKKPPEPEVKTAPIEQKAPVPLQTVQPDESKKALEEADVRKRKALEELRKQSKVAPITQAPETEDPLAKVAQNLAKSGSISSGGTGQMGQHKGYIDLLGQMVKQKYNLPEVYNFKTAGFDVIFTITLSEKGNLTRLDLTKSSGDSIYDDLTKEAIKSAEPFPPPPADLVGIEIPVRFTP